MKFIIIVVAIFFNALACYGQWSKGKGNGYYKISSWYLSTNQHYTDTGEIDPNATRDQFNVSLYAEYGLTKNLDLVGYIPFFARATQNNVLSRTTGAVILEGEAINSIGDIDLGVNYNLYKSDHWSASAKFLFGLPTGENNGGSDGSYQTGDGEFNQILFGLLGYSNRINENIPIYGKAYLGFNNRTQGFSDELRFGVELGLNILSNRLWVVGRIDGVQSLQNGSLNATNAPAGSIFANNISFVSPGVEVNYYFTKKLGISAGIAGAVSGRLIAANPSYTAGVFLDVKNY